MSVPEGLLPWEVGPGAHSPAPGELEAYAELLGVRVGYPEGAIRMGCRGCQPGDQVRHPGKRLPSYCCYCPVLRAQREKRARRAVAAAGAEGDPGVYLWEWNRR